MTCNKEKEACHCIRDEGHTGPCVCDCGGSYNDNGKVYSFPLVSDTFNKEQADEFAESVELRETLRKLTEIKL